MLEKTLTVSELRARLQEIEAAGHGGLPVITEGCDCTGDAGSVEVGPRNVCINRAVEVLTAEEQRAVAEAAKAEEEQRQAKARALWDHLKQGPITDGTL